MTPSQIPRITVDGSPLPSPVAAALIDAVIDDDLYLPDMFELQFNDPQRTLAEQMPFTIGAVVEIHTGALGEDQSTRLINGEVTAIEAILDASGSSLCITGYDQSHRLHRGRKTATFNDVTDSQLAKQIADAAKIDVGIIDPTTDTLAHVAQINETDWSFLQARARQSGNRVYVKDGKFNFRTDAEPEPGMPVKMRYGNGGELLEFRARMTANEQVGAVEVRGWDAETKKPISETASTTIASASLANSSIGAGTIDTTFGTATFVRTDQGIGTSADAKSAAKRLTVDMSSGQLYATGTANGNPHVTANARIDVSGTGKAFDGEWVVSHSRHLFDRLGYTTHFTVSGSQDRSLAGLIAGMAGGAPEIARAINGVVAGIVSDTDDPKHIGRVKVSVPLLGDTFVTDWIRVCYPGAGKERGLFICPENHDEVLVAFSHGLGQEPFVIGSLFNGEDKPDNPTYTASKDGAVTRRAWTSRKGHKIVMLEDPDHPDDDMINLVTKNGVVMSLKDNGELIVDGQSALFNLAKTFDISADGDVTINGKNITINASAVLALAAKSGAKVDGGSKAEIKGGTVTLN